MTLQDGENVAPSGCSTESRTAENETQSRWQNSHSRVVRPRLQPSRTDSLTYNPWKRWDELRGRAQAQPSQSIGPNAYLPPASKRTVLRALLDAPSRKFHVKWKCRSKPTVVSEGGLQWTASCSSRKDIPCTPLCWGLSSPGSSFSGSRAGERVSELGPRVATVGAFPTVGFSSKRRGF